MPRILERIFRLVAVGGQVFAKFISPVMGIIFNNDEDYLVYVDSSGNLVVQCLKTGKQTQIWGDATVQLRTGSYTRMQVQNGLVQVNGGNDFRRNGNNGSYDDSKVVTEELTIPVGLGSGGVDTSAFVPDNANIKRICWIVSQAPGGGAAQFNACLNGDGNGSIANNAAVTLGTHGNNLSAGDGNRSDPWGQAAPVEITVTTDLDVTVSDMKVRFVVFYSTFTDPTS